MSAASTQDCRLLCASGAAYTIVPGQTWSPPSGNKYFDGSGFGSDAVALVGGKADTNACLVGSTQDGVVVAMRGTLSIDFNNPTWAQIKDWLVNDLLGVSPVAVPALGSGVEVQSKWWADVGTFWSELSKEVGKRLVRGKQLFFTGHSKGGPLASMGAARYYSETGTSSQVVTFASPHPGNQAFSNVFVAPGPTQKLYENYGDVVPVLPPTAAQAGSLAAAVLSLDLKWWEKALIEGLLIKAGSWGYEPVKGPMTYIDAEGNPVSDPGSDARLANIHATYEAGGLDAVAAAHCHGCRQVNAKGKATCQGGYMKGVCQGDVCC